MGDLLTYSLADFVLFSPATYARLFQHYQADLFPMAWIGLAAGLFVLWLVFRGRAHMAAIICALCWIWTGWAFHMERYATLNWAALYFGWAFIAQGALLALLGGALRDERRGPALILLALGIVGHPLIGLYSGHAWPDTGLFGSAPDPTAVATLGLALAARGWRRWALAIVPAMWCLIALGTAFGLDRPTLAITAAAGLAIWLALALFKR